MKSLLLATTILAATVLSAASAERVKSIWTGGPAGAYHNTFCPPLEPALAQAQFTGYKCQTSGGSVDNITKVLAQPTSIGFVQLDVYARTVAEKPEVAEKTTVIRQLACEGVWMVTKNPRLKNYGDVLGLSRRLPFIVAGGGSKATFEFMQSLDPEGLGRARNVDFAKDATEVVNRIKGNADAVGVFVQFADPENGNIKAMMEAGATVIPVISRELIRAKADGKDVYQVQTFQLASGLFTAKEATTACTPVALVTGNPKLFTERNDLDDQNDLIREVSNLPEASLLPKEGRIASLIKSAKRMSDTALNETLGAIDAAKKAMESKQ